MRLASILVSKQRLSLVRHVSPDGNQREGLDMKLDRFEIDFFVRSMSVSLGFKIRIKHTWLTAQHRLPAHLVTNSPALKGGSANVSTSNIAKNATFIRDKDPITTQNEHNIELNRIRNNTCPGRNQSLTPPLSLYTLLKTQCLSNS